jgi:hypothetical protein
LNYQKIFNDYGLVVSLMVFNATFNNISAMSWRSVLLVEETGGPGENHRPVTDKLYHIMLYTSPWSRIELTTSVVVDTDCIWSCTIRSRPRRPLTACRYWKFIGIVLDSISHHPFRIIFILENIYLNIIAIYSPSS